MPNVTAVLFDYGLVLSGPPDPVAWEWMKAFFGADETSFHTAYWRCRDDYDRGALTGEECWQLVAKDLGKTLDAAQMQQVIDADTVLWAQPNQPMIDWAAALQHASVKTGILSNMGDATEAGLLARCPWLGGFTHLTFSHSLRMAKPDLAIYKIAAKGLETEPAEILFVDDREVNIAAARTAGMQAVQYTDHAAFLRTMRDEGFGYLLDL
jgi:putative hydrolase of the HAD superfamily